MKWYETYSNVVGLGAWLDGECDYFATTCAVTSFFEKPWKYSNEFELWQLWQVIDEARRQEVIDAVVEELSPEQVIASEREQQDAELADANNKEAGR